MVGVHDFRVPVASRHYMLNSMASVLLFQTFKSSWTAMPSDRSKKKSAVKAKGPKSKEKPTIAEDKDQIEQAGSEAEDVAEGVVSILLEAPSSSSAAPASKSGSGGEA